MTRNRFGYVHRHKLKHATKIWQLSDLEEPIFVSMFRGGGGKGDKHLPRQKGLAEVLRGSNTPWPRPAHFACDEYLNILLFCEFIRSEFPAASGHKSLKHMRYLGGTISERLVHGVARNWMAC